MAIWNVSGFIQSTCLNVNFIVPHADGMLYDSVTVFQSSGQTNVAHESNTTDANGIDSSNIPFMEMGDSITLQPSLDSVDLVSNHYGEVGLRATGMEPNFPLILPGFVQLPAAHGSPRSLASVSSLLPPTQGPSVRNSPASRGPSMAIHLGSCDLDGLESIIDRSGNLRLEDRIASTGDETTSEPSSVSGQEMGLPSILTAPKSRQSVTPGQEMQSGTRIGAKLRRTRGPRNDFRTVTEVPTGQLILHSRPPI
jgi:hypothetical protein